MRWFSFAGFAVAALGTLAVSGCPQQGAGTRAQAAQESINQDSAEVIQLPKPRLEGDVAVEKALAARRSLRRFGDEPVTLAEVGQLLWAAQGITDTARGFRTAPSAGALFPLEVYVVVGNVTGLDDGLYHYSPRSHTLMMVSSDDLRGKLYSASYEQSCLREAPVLFCVAAVYERTSVKYGAKAQRFAHIEIGHVGQNIYLQAVALGLGAVAVGGYDDAAVKAALDLPAEEVPLYLIPVGPGR